MAKRKGTRYRTRTVTRYRKKGATLNPFIHGFVAGAGGEFGTRWLGNWSHPIATTLTGWVFKNNTLKVEGARELGAMLVSQIGIGGGTQGGGLYES